LEICIVGQVIIGIGVKNKLAAKKNGNLGLVGDE